MCALLTLPIILMLTNESTASNRHSFLLRLPQEIQDQIFKLVCGGNLLHIKFAPNTRNPRTSFCHVLCISNITENEAQASFYASTSPWFDEVCANRHEACCSTKLFRDLSGCIWGRLTLDLRFLRTCRQIYDAAMSICYTTNIFSFGSLRVFMMFGKTVSWVPRIRSLRLRVQCVNNGSEPASSEALKQALGNFTGVKSIHIDLEQVFFDNTRTYDKKVEENSLLTQQLLGFGGKALKAAAVIISDARFCDSNFLERTQVSQDDERSLRRRRWTLTEKQEYAHFLRNALLEH